MKNSLYALLLVSLTLRAGAQSLSASLTEAYDRLSSATTLPARMDAVNRFTMISAKWDKEWAANYYAAYVRALDTYKETDPKRKDQLLDEADRYVEKATALQPSGCESLVIAAYVAYARFSVDPPNRWKKYLDLFNADLEKAKKIDPNDPRIYYLEGIPVFNRPVLYGGGRAKARPYFEKAAGLFAKQDTGSILKPYWGQKDNSDYLQQAHE